VHLTLGVLARSPVVGARQAGKVHRVGYLSAGGRDSAEHLLQAFVRAVRDLGWVEGQKLILEWRWADGTNERVPALAAELIERRVDVALLKEAIPRASRA